MTSSADRTIQIITGINGRERVGAFPLGVEGVAFGGAGGLQPGVNLEDREALADLLGDNAVP